MIQAAEIIGTGLATTGVINVIGLLFAFIIVFYLLFVAYITTTNTNFRDLYLLMVSWLLIVLRNFIDCVSSERKLIRYIRFTIIVILAIWAYIEFVGFTVIHCASDINPGSIQGLRIAIALLEARRGVVQSAAFREHARLREVMSNRSESPLNVTHLTRLAQDENSLTSEIAGLTTRLNTLLESE